MIIWQKWSPDMISSPKTYFFGCFQHFSFFHVSNRIPNRILLEITVHFWHGTPSHWQVTVLNWFQIVSKCPWVDTECTVWRAVYFGSFKSSNRILRISNRILLEIGIWCCSARAVFLRNRSRRAPRLLSRQGQAQIRSKMYVPLSAGHFCYWKSLWSEFWFPIEFYWKSLFIFGMVRPAIGKWQSPIGSRSSVSVPELT